MSTRPTQDIALLVAPARAALHGEASREQHARAVRLARARTLSGAPRRRSTGRVASLRRGALAVAFAAFALAACLLGRSWLRRRDVSPPVIAFSAGDVPGVVGERIAATTLRVLVFDDGTRVGLDEGSALRVIALDDRGGRLLVEQGTIRAAFQHRERSYWTVEAGGVVVEVTGTRFDVSFDQVTQSFALVMHEGSVRVRGCGIEEGRVVRGTEVIRARCAAVAPPVTPADLPDAPPPTVAPGTPGAPVRTTRAPSVAVDSSMALLQRADVERRAGDTSAARETLLELRLRFPRGAAAPEAAFDLGVLAFDVEGRFADAVRWFRRYLDEAPQGPLAREALGRLMEAQSRGGESEAASSSAARYLEQYPGGPHASLAKGLVAPPH